ncbi:hypothetical protein F383_38889 [Gossypium arboreum]|uniref:Uncharacterized protein n=1 Tax=Gossypium arboreum TaxID=29729 RepID=A0A0B0MDP6_GOSAR|nr:hypothetical protein F383_38889 [Gossypium arboreum]
MLQIEVFKYCKLKCLMLQIEVLKCCKLKCLIAAN